MHLCAFSVCFLCSPRFMGTPAWASLPAQVSLSDFNDWSTGEMNGLAL